MRLVLHQSRFDQRTFWRDPAAVFFTVALPLIFLFIFVTIFGNATGVVNGHKIKGSTYYIPGIVALAVISATMVNLGISLATLRERGELKRVRATPLPPWVFMAGRIGTSVVVTLLLVIIVVAVGRLVYGVAIPTSTLPALLVTLVVGAGAFCSLGFVLAALSPTENSAPAIANAIVLPLYFLSGVFIPNEELPRTMQRIADLFPVKHFFEGLLVAFDPATAGAGLEPGRLAAVAAWGLVALVAAVFAFRWAPRSG